MEWCRRHLGWVIFAMALHPVVDAETDAHQVAELAGGNWLGQTDGSEGVGREMMEHEAWECR